MAELFGAARAAGMADSLREFARGFGLQDMRVPERLQNTRGILAASEYARDQGRLDLFREAAMDAYWREGRNLEDLAVVREVAERAGLDPDGTAAAVTSPEHLGRIEAIRREAGLLGVSGIPTFFIGRHRIVGCQPYEILAAAVEDSAPAP